MKLERNYVEKPWGRTRLPSMFADAPPGRIGEVWFVAQAPLPLLAKYLFTSDRLSIQVHPDDAQARTRGLASGKSECWYILEAEPDARIALGFRRDVTRAELRASAMDRSIVDLVAWRSVAAGDVFYVPAGTVHAIGGGLSLLEFQQNSDSTFRLYDYGRPRELHLDDATAVAHLTTYPDGLATHVGQGEDAVLVECPQFTLVQARSDRLTDRRRWILPLEGSVCLRDDVAGAGECLVANPGERVETNGARMLIGAES